MTGTHGKRFSQGEWPAETIFTPMHGLLDLGSFHAELIYSGLAGNVVRIVYREYVDNLARPAFQQELQYDLDDSKTIRFRSVIIEVLAATNQTIQYKVVADGGLPWIPR